MGLKPEPVGMAKGGRCQVSEWKTGCVMAGLYMGWFATGYILSLVGVWFGGIASI